MSAKRNAAPAVISNRAPAYPEPITLVSAAAQEYRLHSAEGAARHYAKRDAVPALAGTDAFSARAYASAYDKRAAKVRSTFFLNKKAHKLLFVFNILSWIGQLSVGFQSCMCRHPCLRCAAEVAQYGVCVSLSRVISRYP